MFSCDFCEIFKNTFFIKHLRTTASETELITFKNGCFEYLNDSQAKKHSKAESIISKYKIAYYKICVVQKD